MSDLETLKEALSVAQKNECELVRERNEEARHAKKKVFERYRETVSAASDAVAKAARALKEYKSQNATHVWEGKRVQKEVYAHTWSRNPSLIYGVVEVRRIGTDFPQNATWSIPEIGGAFVRLEKKDGKLGKRIDRLGSWKLIDGEAA